MKLRLALPFFLLPAGDLLADTLERDQALKLPDVVISASRQVETRHESSAANTVFTRADIDRLQPGSVADLLSRVPGVQVAQSGGSGSLPGIHLRGTASAQTLVLIDGQRMGSATSGDSNLQFLNIDQIERVEVLRGSRSAIYGSDAIGGVIQLFTRRGEPQGLRPRLHVGVGSNQHWERSLGLSGGNGQTRFSLDASLDETQGIDWTRQSYPSDEDHDAYRNQSLGLNLSHALSEDLEVGLNLLHSQGRSEYDSPFGRYDPGTGQVVEQDPYTDFMISNIGTHVDATLNEHWSSRLELGHSENRDKKRDKLSNERNVFNTYRDSVTWQNDLTLTERNSLIAGADWYEDRVNSSAAFDEDSRWNRAVFVQHRYSTEDFSTELGVRRDQNQQFGSQNSWSGTFTLPLNPDNDLRFSYSESFRAPTFSDLYYPDNGNPDLKPEHSKSYELQWRSRLSDTSSLETSLYRTDIKDAIVYDSLARRPENIASARINGFEAALKQQWFGWQSNLALAIIDPRDRDTGHTLQRRARRTLSLDLDRQFDRLSLGATWQAVSSSYDNKDNEQRLGGYALLGLRSSWALSQEVLLSLKVDNLLDKAYARSRYSYLDPNFENNHDYRQQGQTWMFGVTWTPML